MNRNIFVISDTHFGHRNMYNFMEEDGFHCRHDANKQQRVMEETDELMVENWNSVVKDYDIVYHCGDAYFGKGHEYLYRLKGRKRLILGNHDDPKDGILPGVFEKIMVWRMWPEWKVVLTHIPIHESALRHKVTHNIHGHIHRKVSPSPNHINVSVEMIDYKPVALEDIIKEHRIV
jgi:calcineurin-like phosphoesterase family protein